MRVILGEKGKKLTLEDQLKQMDLAKTIIINGYEVNSENHDNAFHIKIKSYAELIATFEHLEKDIEFMSGIQNVILDLRIHFQDTDVLLKWEDRLNKKFIVTVQNNELDKVMVFDMSLPD